MVFLAVISVRLLILVCSKLQRTLCDVDGFNEANGRRQACSHLDVFIIDTISIENPLSSYDDCLKEDEPPSYEDAVKLMCVAHPEQ